MRKSAFFILSMGIALMTACSQEKTSEVVSESADKKATVKVSGVRSTSMDPFQTSIIMSGYGQSDTLITEVYAGDLNSETVKITWSDNANCILTLTQQDDSKRVMSIGFAESGNSLRELNK